MFVALRNKIFSGTSIGNTPAMLQ